MSDGHEILRERCNNAPGGDVPAGLHILVVEDDALVSLGTAAALSDLGHVPIEARSAQEALALLDERPDYDLILTDYRLSGMSGGELISEALAKWPWLKAAVMSGYPRRLPDVPEHVPWMAKPLCPRNIARLINELSPWPRLSGQNQQT